MMTDLFSTGPSVLSAPVSNTAPIGSGWILLQCLDLGDKWGSFLKFDKGRVFLRAPRERMVACALKGTRDNC